MTAEGGPDRTRPGFASRLLIAQALVLVAGAATSWIVAAAVGPSIFQDHLQRAGVTHTPSEATHVERAFASAMLVSVVVAVLVALLVALAVTWFFTRRLQRSIDAVGDSASRIADGDYRTRVARPGLGTEFDQLAETINRLAGRLGAVEQTRRRMLADLAHEMRTPLATIDAHVEAIEDGLRDADRETLTVIRASTDRLVRLAQDVGAVSRAEEGQLVIEVKPVLATDIVATAIAAAQSSAQTRGVSLVAKVEADVGRILGDRERLGQVFANLLDNAIRHSPAGAVITVSCRGSGNGWVEFSLTDTGDGIAPEHIRHVFDRFYRADTARNREQGGSGIGLTITRALVEAQGGRISVASSVGVGTTFTIRLRAARVTSSRVVYGSR